MNTKIGSSLLGTRITEGSLEEKSGMGLPFTNSFTFFHSALLSRNILKG